LPANSIASVFFNISTNDLFLVNSIVLECVKSTSKLFFSAIYVLIACDNNLAFSFSSEADFTLFNSLIYLGVSFLIILGSSLISSFLKYLK